jgi:hypothetical protein
MTVCEEEEEEEEQSIIQSKCHKDDVNGDVDDDVDDQQDGDDHDDESSQNSMGSADEALLEMLGLCSLKDVGGTVVTTDDDDDDDADEHNNTPDHAIPYYPPRLIMPEKISQVMLTIQREYEEQSVCVFPSEFSISAEYMRRMTEELVWGGPSVQADRTYETIQVWKDGAVEERRTLTRLENFVDGHRGWNELCHGYLRRVLSAALGTEMVLYKEKLNLKPPGGSGFAPHLDSPSLRVALGPDDGPQTFCTVMVAIDDQTSRNGCLRICRGPWTEHNACTVVRPEAEGNPDAGGRAGAIPPDVAESLQFDDLVCRGGTVVAFNGWAPHRSAANVSPFPRRAVFLTYNPKSEGEFHKTYYQRMELLRNEWREKVGRANRGERCTQDEELESNALATIPKI